MPETPSDRETLVAAHVERYGLSTHDALHRMVLGDLTDKAVRRLAERLVASGWLARKHLPGGGRYFVLGERGARERGTRPGRAFGYQALVSRLGVLHYCARLGVDVLTPAEFREQFPELVVPGLTAANYYIDRGEVNRLAFLHVDHGRTAERLVTKMGTRLASRFRSETFAGLIVRGRFLIAVAVPTEEKARAVRDELAGRGPLPVPLRVEAVPELLPLLLGGPAAPRRSPGDA
jgi:hypothetical protein